MIRKEKSKMPFTVDKRVVYERNTLEEVICQVRFPPILKLKRYPPDLQEKYQNQFPVTNEKDVKQISVTYNDGASVVEHTERYYEFISEDEKWRITITSDTFSLTTTEYRRWEGFKKVWDEAYNAFADKYKPVHFSRIGLRYRNVINKDELGLQDLKWKELVSASIAGPLLSETVKREDLNIYQGQCIFKLTEEAGNLAATYGLGENQITNTEVFIIDADFFKSSEEKTKLERESLDATLENFKTRAHGFFRWAISPTLHNALEPSSAESNEKAT